MRVGIDERVRGLDDLLWHIGLEVGASSLDVVADNGGKVSSGQHVMFH